MATRRRGEPVKRKILLVSHLPLTRQMEEQHQRDIQRNAEIRIGRANIQREENLRHEAEWREDIKGKVFNQLQQEKDNELKRELQMANRELVMVRRAALQQQLSLDYQQYRHDLNCRGTTFYMQRL
uniref:Uncharacterized protein C1orf189 homolog n=1 Tax=Geotrypetes seraphini TaxID=260995 RepID=A0A6P8Q1F7_GEOSA|nr:uncharacterized protein C1orf189 homolog [Geotrypetes seraphini]